MKINFDKDAKISIYNPVFDVMRNELDINLRAVVAEMIGKDMNSGSVTLKIEVTTSKDIINDDNSQTGTRPAMNIEIDADVSSVIQKKDKTKVDVITRKHQKELVIDDNGQLCIVSREEASGQLSMFNSWDEYKNTIEEGK